jgi:hypothetical protein
LVEFIFRFPKSTRALRWPEKDEPQPLEQPGFDAG